MRSFVIAGLCVVVASACGGKHTGTGDDDDDDMSPDACVGLQCQVVDCVSQSMPATTISGTVFAPNGTLPLYGIDVYIPTTDPGSFADGVACGNCATDLPGVPIAKARTDEAGKFTLTNVPAGDNIPLIITTGKWRRKITLPHVGQCADTPIADGDARLPKTKAEGDIPKIAITTGSADSLECLVRRLGIDDTEITTDAKDGRVHLYKGNGVGKFDGGDSFSSANTLWDSATQLAKYDIVIFSCEGAQNANTKSQDAMNNVKQYADVGGRVFMSHWHNIWIEGDTQGNSGTAPQVWPTIATWSNNGNLGDGVVDSIDEVANAKGMSFATWMLNVMGSTTRDQIAILDGTGKTTCNAVDPEKAERWVYFHDPDSGTELTQNFQFTTPNEQPVDSRCGKVVFSDMHVSGNAGNGDYPSSCGGATTLSAQEKALAFMFFDISSCVGQIF